MRAPWYTMILSVALICLLSSCNKADNFSLEHHQHLDSFPSGSSIVYFNQQVFITGDDAPGLLQTNMEGKKVRDIILYPNQQARIPRSEKADLEAGTVYTDGRGKNLLFLGSGSQEIRKVAWLIDPFNDHLRAFRIDTFYNRLQAAGVEQLNIEALAQVPGWLVLGNRGNQSYRKNHLILAENRFWEKQQTAKFHLIFLGNPASGDDFAGVSGMDYDYLTDRLFLTYSTEDTESVMHDGAVGNSYLAMVRDISGKLNYAAINPNKSFGLQAIHPALAKMKIESVAVAESIKTETTLLLVADNDDGKTWFFKLKMMP